MGSLGPISDLVYSGQEFTVTMLPYIIPTPTDQAVSNRGPLALRVCSFLKHGSDHQKLWVVNGPRKIFT